MRTEPTSQIDGASLARSVRSVAGRARRALMRPADPRVAHDLLDAIAPLELSAQARSSEELARWLSSLRDRIESHGGAALRGNPGSRGQTRAGS